MIICDLNVIKTREAHTGAAAAQSSLPRNLQLSGMLGDKVLRSPPPKLINRFSWTSLQSVMINS